MIAEAYFRQSMRAAREAQQMSQRALCERLAAKGVVLDTSAVTRIELGQRVVRLGEAILIADVLGFPLTNDVPSPDLELAQQRILSVAAELVTLANTLQITGGNS